MKQVEISKINEEGWNNSAYQAWVNRHGYPREYAKQLISNPEWIVSHYLKLMGDVRGKKIANLLGSKGNKAVSFALLGADVTIVDISQDNSRYALELADGAGVSIKYVVSDVLDIPEEDKLVDCDFVLLELGVLHYFVDLQPLFQLVYRSLKLGGKVIVRDYHPVVSKLLHVEENKVIADGNYFETDVVDVDVAYSILLSDKEKANLPQNTIRKWTLGEIVTSIAATGLHINMLQEESGVSWAYPKNFPKDMEEKVPGLFTIAAYKI